MIERTRSPVNLLPLAALAVVAGLLAGGCDRPCQKLVDRLCAEGKSNDGACERWKERAGRVSTQTCQAALRVLDQ